MIRYIIFLFPLIICFLSDAQNVGVGTLSPHPSAMLDISATNKGLLVPRLTSAKRTGIPSPAQGLLVFDTDTRTFWFYSGYDWVNIPFNLPYYDQGSTPLATFGIINNGSGPGIWGHGKTGPGLSALADGNGLAGAALRVENTNVSGIGIWSITNSADANTVMANSGSGDLLRAFSGLGAGNLVSRLLNNGTFITTGKIGIGTNVAPIASLEVNGTVKIADGTQGNGKILSSDANGNASWKSAPVNPAANTFFEAAKTGNIETHQYFSPSATNHTEKVKFPVAYVDAGSNYNSATSTYTIPQSGFYFFHTRVTIDMNFDGHVWLELHAGLSAVAFNHFNLSSVHGNLKTVSLAHSGFFSAGTQITVQITLPVSDDYVVFRSDSEFSGWRVW